MASQGPGQKKFLSGAGLFLLCLTLSCAKSPYPEAPGDLFIRQTAKDINAFKEAFADQAQALRASGATAFSLHRDLKDAEAFILTLKSSNLKKTDSLLRSYGFRSAMRAAGVREGVTWAGTDVMERKYENRRRISGGIVIANNQVRSYEFWKSCWDAEGKHKHPKRGYEPSRYSIHCLKGKTDSVLVVHEASDVSKAPAFMTSDRMKGVMESMGVTGIEIWYGINLQEGIF